MNVMKMMLVLVIVMVLLMITMTKDNGDDRATGVYPKSIIAKPMKILMTFNSVSYSQTPELLRAIFGTSSNIFFVKNSEFSLKEVI
jgi:hypothetical protein